MKALISAAVLFVTASLTIPALAQNQSERTVEVTGHGDAKAKPDTVVISFAAEDQADTADACTAEHAAKVRKLIDALKAATGAGGKITSGEYSLTPNTVYSAAIQPAKPEPIVQTPWTLSMGVPIEVDSLEDLGLAVEVAIADGASNRLQGSGFEEVPIAQPKPQQSSSRGLGDAAPTDSTPLGAPGVFIGRGSYYGGPPVPTKRVAFATVEIDTEGSSISECTRKANEILHRIQKDLADKLNGKTKMRPEALIIAQKQSQPAPAYVPPPPQIRKQVLQAHSTITVETSDLDKLGQLVQTGIDSGATRLNNITFTLSSDNEARKEAVDKASADAKRKAEEVAKSMGVKLGKILKISTNATPQPQVIYGQSYAGSFAASSLVHRAESLPVMPREVGFAAEVSVAYAIE